MVRTAFRFFALSVVLALVAGLLTGPATARAKAQTRLSLTVAESVVSGEQVQVTGRLIQERFSRPAATKTVVVQLRTAGTDRWRNAGRGTTGADGSYSVAVTALADAQVRARFAGTRRLAASTSRVAAITAQQSLSLTSEAPERLDADEPLSMSATASPGLVGNSVLLEQRTDRGTWVRLDAAAVPPGGAISLSGVPVEGGFERAFRIRVPASPSTPVMVAETGLVTVLAWYDLTELDPQTEPAEDTASRNFLRRGAGTLAGIAFRPSWASLYTTDQFPKFDDGRAGFLLNAACEVLEARIGIPDGAGAQAAWLFRTVTDGAEVNHGELTVGVAEALTLPLAGVVRLRLLNDRRLGEPDGAAHAGDAVWADARVKCAGLPEAAAS